MTLIIAICIFLIVFIVSISFSIASKKRKGIGKKMKDIMKKTNEINCMGCSVFKDCTKRGWADKIDIAPGSDVCKELRDESDE